MEIDKTSDQQDIKEQNRECSIQQFHNELQGLAQAVGETPDCTEFIEKHSYFGLPAETPALKHDIIVAFNTLAESHPDISTLPPFAISKLLQAELDKLEKVEAKSEFSQLTEKLRRKEISNQIYLDQVLALAETDKTTVPPEFITQYRDFQKLLSPSLVTNQDDRKIITQSFDTLDFATNPDPILFIQTEVLANDRISKETKTTVAEAFDISRIPKVTGTQVNDALSIQDEDGNPKFTKASPFPVRDGVSAFVNKDGTRIARVEVDGIGIREVPWNANENGNVIGLKISLLKIWSLMESQGQTDFMGEGIHIDNSILSQTDPAKLRKVQQIMMAFLGGDAGYDGEIINDEQAEFIAWANQYLSTKGDASAGDFDQDIAIKNRTALGIHPPDHPEIINFDVLRTAGSFMQEQYMMGNPDYSALKLHLNQIYW